MGQVTVHLSVWIDADELFGWSGISSYERLMMQEQALYLLGRGLHSIQDIEAHRRIGINNPLLAEHGTRWRADNPNWDWANSNRWTLSRSDARVRYNTSIDMSVDFLGRFYRSIGRTN